MTQPPESPACPDCAAPLEDVALFGRGPVNPLTGAAIDSAVTYYAAAPAKRGSIFWSAGMLTPMGWVQARMCTACRRIFLYGVPR